MFMETFLFIVHGSDASEKCLCIIGEFCNFDAPCMR